MNRIIKFRVWQKEEKKMLNWQDWEPEIKDAIPWDCGDEWTESCEVMQFTGLLDADNKEIYEGDIVECPRSLMYEKMVLNVHWDLEDGRWAVSNEKAEVDWNLSKEFAKAELKVIGNIFENKELK